MYVISMKLAQVTVLHSSTIHSNFILKYAYNFLRNGREN